MTHDEMEKAMEFIIKQQAQFAVEMQQMREVQAGFQTQLGKLTDATLTLTGLMGKVLQAQAKTEERFAKLDERFAKMDERFAKMDERFQALEQKLSQTDDRLNVLINIVERYITGRNGKPEE